MHNPLTVGFSMETDPTQEADRAAIKEEEEEEGGESESSGEDEEEEEEEEEKKEEEEGGGVVKVHKNKWEQALAEVLNVS
jgi:hypothetical protein